MNPPGCIRTGDDLLQHADAFALAVGCDDHLLHVQVLAREQIELTWVERFVAERLFAFPHALTPFGMAVAETFHLELEDRFHRDGSRFAGEIHEIDLGGRGEARAAVVLHAMARGGHAFVAAVLHAWHGRFVRIERCDDAFAHQRFAFRAVEEDRVRDVVFPEQRGPQEEDAARHHRRTAGFRFADTAHAPRAILRAVALVHLDLAVGMTNDAGPAPELIEARRVHGAARAGPQRLARFLNGAALRAENVRSHAMPLLLSSSTTRVRFSGSTHFDAERTHLHVGAFHRCAPRTVEAVLARVALLRR